MNRGKVRGAEEEAVPITGVGTFLSFTFSFYSVQFKAFAVRSDSKHHSDVQKSRASITSLYFVSKQSGFCIF